MITKGFHVDVDVRMLVDGLGTFNMSCAVGQFLDNVKFLFPFNVLRKMT